MLTPQPDYSKVVVRVYADMLGLNPIKQLEQTSDDFTREIALKLLSHLHVTLGLGVILEDKNSCIALRGELISIMFRLKKLKVLDKREQLAQSEIAQLLETIRFLIDITDMFLVEEHHYLQRDLKGLKAEQRNENHIAVTLSLIPYFRPFYAF